ncbi:PAS domain-containing protein [Azorhizobium sp. AG788]|uniref:PAS domain-containing protein n=1 Tax=Azorhizobium sp. AG788 TaxID=2183897 RepID=UPI0031391D5D
MTEPTHRMPPHQEALFAPLRRDDLPSFLVVLPDMLILAATPACTALGIEAGSPAPLGVKIVAKRVGMSLRHAPRLERVRLPYSFVPKAFACIAVQAPAGHLVVFADPLALATGATAAKALPGLTRLPTVTTPASSARSAARSVRFTWEADEAGRLQRLSPHAVEVLGSALDQWLGRDFDELAEDGLLVDGAPMRAALRSGGSFFGLTLLSGARPPRRIEFGGVPLFDAARRRLGTRGFGLIWGDGDGAARPRQTADRAPAPAEPAETQGFNVVPLRGGALSARERSAFHEIARTLTEAIEEWPKPPAALAPPEGSRDEAPGQMEPPASPMTAASNAAASTTSAPGGVPMPQPQPEAADNAAAAPSPSPSPASGQATDGLGEEHLLDRLPIGIVVQQGGVTVRANKTLLGWLGLKDTADFIASGGLSPRLVRDGRTGGLDLESLDGDRLPVEVRLVSSPWNGRPALVHVIRTIEGAVTPSQPAGPEVVPGPAPAAPAPVPSVSPQAAKAETAALVRAERVAARRQALDFIPFPVLLLDRNGTVETANAAAVDVAGFAAEDVEDEPFTLLLGQDSHLTAVAMLDRACASPEMGVQEAHLTLRHRAGARIPVEAALAPTGEAGRRFCLVMRPISDQPAAVDPGTDGLPAASISEESAARLDGLVRRISHDLREPLTTVLAFVDSVKLGIFGPVGNARYTRQAETAGAAGEILLAALSDLDGMTLMPSATPDRILLAPVIEEALGHCAAAAQRRRVLLRSSLAEHLAAPCDAAGLARLLRLLLEEALRATPADGQVIVTLAADAQDASRAVVQIRDGGPALGEDEINQALDLSRSASTSDRFSRAGRPFRMAHLALLARALGGTLSLGRGLDVGMLARLELPR